MTTMSKRFVLSRRTVLRGMAAGVAAAVALPTLEAMVGPSGEALAGTAPLRYLVWFFGNGVVPWRWNPATQGAGWTSEETAPLDADPEVKKYISILTGFNSRAPMKITHHEGTIIFNGYPFQLEGGLTSYAGGPTLDQVIATKLMGQTNVKSLQVGVSSKLSYMDGGTSMFALSHAAAGPGGALPPQFNPQAVWTKLFGSFTVRQDASGPLRVSVLDAVKDNTEKLKKRLGKNDLQRLDQHLDGISELQKKIQAAPPLCASPAKPGETNTSLPEHLDETADAMHELITYALACDLTRVASVLMHGGAAATYFSNLGQTVEHHMDNTHAYPGDPGAEGRINQVVIWHMQKLAGFLKKLHSTPDGTSGSLLDNSVVFVSSDCSSGWDHSVDDQPMLIAGGGGGKLVHPGIHYHSPNGQNPTDVLLSLLQMFDPAATSVGGGVTMSTTPLAAIKAG
jgi:hypothetical protein